MNTMDILYIHGKGFSNWHYNELRYSLRGLDKFGQHVDRIFIAGWCPPFVNRNTVTYIPVRDETTIKHHNIQRCIEQAVSQTDIGEEFLLSSDDHFYIAPTDFDAYPFYWRGVELPTSVNPKDPNRDYRTTLYSTRRVLEACGLPCHHLAWHGNTHFSRRIWESDRMVLMRRLALTMPEGCEPTCLIGNLRVATEGVQLVVREDCKVGQDTSKEDFEKKIQDRECVSATDNIERSVLAPFLQNLLPHKSKWEL